MYPTGARAKQSLCFSLSSHCWALFVCFSAGTEGAAAVSLSIWRIGGNGIVSQSIIVIGLAGSTASDSTYGTA
ncbi:hypothetical protein BX600DRAFT_463018 [Xylariales sp. PMI_506]|nr:hypothetical protein BX600DRAFT_463018 [Xylariales sp. PMI_506]